jgi:DNA-binding CsgD family transcriptional regulator
VTDSAAPGTPAEQLDARDAWRRTHDRLVARDRATLSAGDLDTLAEAYFWLDRPDDSVTARRQAYARHLVSGDRRRAAAAAWQLYYDHALVGEMAVANGWLERARQHVEPRDGSTIDGFVSVAEADHAHGHGDLAAALGHAERAVAVGVDTGDRDLLAMARQTQGRLLVASGQLAEGMARLDDAMVSVIDGELRPLFTGWVYCSVLGVCHDVADLGRAAEWTGAALRWCEGLGDGRLYPGLCRVHRVELASLGGAWTTAEREARRACDELLAHDPRYAGEAIYLAADLARMRGDLEAAIAGFQQAHAFGREPQPGLALVWLDQGRVAVAVAALRSSLRPGPVAPMARAGLLAALIDAELAQSEVTRAAVVVDELLTLAAATCSPYLQAITADRQGALALARSEADAALTLLRGALAGWRSLGMPYAAARTQVALADATLACGDEATARLELRSALDGFERLGAVRDAERVRGMLAAAPDTATPLTRRELEVLRHVARGRTNRQVGAALVISEHTVARHLSNIFTKLGVASRAAATAYAYEHDLAYPPPQEGG